MVATPEDHSRRGTCAALPRSLGFMPKCSILRIHYVKMSQYLHSIIHLRSISEYLPIFSLCETHASFGIHMHSLLTICRLDSPSLEASIHLMHPIFLMK